MSDAHGKEDTVGAASVPVAFVLANALSYLLVLLAAHRLHPAAYGELSSLLGLLVLAAVPMFAVQTVAARRVASGGDLTGLPRSASLISLGCVGLLCAGSVPLAAFLHLHGVGGVLLVAAAVPAHVALGLASGVAQGRRRFRSLAALLLASTGSRSLGAIVGLFATGTVTGALVGALAGVVLGALPVLRPLTRLPGRTGHGVTEAPGAVLAETLHAAHAHSAFLVLTSLNVLLARHVLDAHDGGVFAVGAVVSKASVWLPQSVVLLLFASLAQDDAHVVAVRRSVATVLGLGVAGVLVSAGLGRIVVSAVGGRRYHDLDSTLWLFALLGALLAVLQLAMMAGLAQRHRGRIAILWATVLAQTGVALLLGRGATPTSLAVAFDVVTAVSAATALCVLLGLPVPRRRATATA